MHVWERSPTFCGCNCQLLSSYVHKRCFWSVDADILMFHKNYTKLGHVITCICLLLLKSEKGHTVSSLMKATRRGRGEQKYLQWINACSTEGIKISFILLSVTHPWWRSTWLTLTDNSTKGYKFSPCLILLFSFLWLLIFLSSLTDIMIRIYCSGTYLSEITWQNVS